MVKARCHSHHRHYFVNSLLTSGDIIQTAVEIKVFIGSKIPVQESIMSNYANPSPGILSVLFNVQSVNNHLTRGGIHDGSQHFEQSWLPCPVGAEKSNRLPRLYFK